MSNDHTTATQSGLTQHFVARHIDAGHSECRIGVGHVLVHGELPVVDAARETHRTDGHPMLPAVHRNGGVVVAEQQPRAETVAELRIEGEPSDWRKRRVGLVDG